MAVTIAMPGFPGLQMETVGSQDPAQALPLLATERGAGAPGVPLATKYEAAPTITCPNASVALVEKTCVPPTSIEKLLPGLRETLLTPALVGLELLLPKHPLRARANVMVRINKKPEQQRCMNPPRVQYPGASIQLTGKLPV
jgi:hypothetical protein